MPERIPVRRTIVTLDALAASVWRAWPDAEDVDVAILFGKMIAENGWPNAAQTTWNWNLGNLRGVSPAGRFHVLRNAWELVAASKVAAMRSLGWTEIPPPPQATVTPGTVCMLPPPERQGFRSYLTLDEAVGDLLATLGRSFRHAWEELQREGSDVARFVAAMKSDGYFSGDVTQYTKNARAGFDHAIAHMPPRPAPEPAAPPPPHALDASRWAPSEYQPIADVRPFLETLAGGEPT